MIDLHTLAKNIFLIIALLWCSACIYNTPAITKAKPALVPELVIQKGHSDGIRSIALSKNNQFFVTGSTDKYVKIWDNAGWLVKNIAMDFEVKYVDFFNDDRDIFVASRYNQMVVLDVKGHVKYKLPKTGDTGVNWASCVSPDAQYFLQSSSNRGLYLLTKNHYKILHKPGDKSSEIVTTCVFNHDSKSFFISDRAGHVTHMDLQGNILHRKTLAHNIATMTRHVSGKIVMAGSNNWKYRNRVKSVTNLIWDNASGGFTSFTSKPLADIAFSHDGMQLFLLESKTSNIVLTDLNGVVKSQFKAKNGYTKSKRVVATKEGRLITIGDNLDSVISFWNDQGTLLRSNIDKFNSIGAIASNKNSRYLAAASSVNIRLWSITGKLLDILKTTQDQRVVTYAKSGELLASGGNDLFLWDVTKRQRKATLKGHKHGITGIVFANNDQLIFTVGGDGYLNKYARNDHHDYVLQKRYKIDQRRLEYIALHPYREVLNIASDSGVVASYDFNGKKLWSYTESVPRGRATVVSADYSPDGKYLAVLYAYLKDDIIIFDEKGHVVRALQGYNRHNIGKIAFSPSGKMLVSSNNRSLIIWNAKTWKPVRVLKNHRSQVTTFAFPIVTRDDLLTVGSRNATMTMWNIISDYQATLLFKGKEWIIYDTDGYYYSINKDSSLVYYGLKDKLCFGSVLVKKLSFNRPDIIFKKLDLFKEDHLKKLQTSFSKLREAHLVVDKQYSQNSCQ